MQLTSQSSGPLQLEGVNGKLPNQADKSSSFAKRAAMQPKKKKTMGQRMMGKSAAACPPNSSQGGY
jgi:hypothetical protein